MDQMKRSSRSGSLVNTPDHRKTTIQAVPPFDDDIGGDSGNYLVACDLSTPNSTNSFDTMADIPPDVPPVPPRILNPPRKSRTEQLIIIDTDDIPDVPPVPYARTKPRFQTMTKPTNLQPILEPRSQSINSLNIQKNNGINRAPPPNPPSLIIEPPQNPYNHKLNMTNESINSNTSEVRRISSYIPNQSFFFFLSIHQTNFILISMCVIFSYFCKLSPLAFFCMYFSVAFCHIQI